MLSRVGLAYVLPLLAIAVLGSVHLHETFHGDQALYAVGARALDAGAVLYRDYWDQKQPGIYAFYLAAGRVFWPTEAGVHLFELIYHLAFAALLIHALRSELEHKWLASVAALTTVGAYYMYADRWHLTQIEALVGAPIFVALWLGNRALDHRSMGRAFGAGVAGGSALLLKLALAPILIVGWAIAFYLASRASARRCLGGLLGGLVIAIGGAALWFAAHGALGEFLWTTFVYPFAALGGLEGAPLSRIVGGVIGYGKANALLGALALLAWSSWRGARRERLTLQLAAWLAASACVFAIQRFMWWPFHMLTLVVPIGVLAARGLDGLLARVQSTAAVAVAAACALAPSFVRWESVRWQSARERHLEYEEMQRSTRFLAAPDAAPGPIYVLGNPLNLYLSGRAAAAPIHGWGWEVLLDRHWSRLNDDLRAARPAYFYLDDEAVEPLRANASDIHAWIEAEYVAVGRDRVGTWYAAN